MNKVLQCKQKTTLVFVTLFLSTLIIYFPAIPIVPTASALSFFIQNSDSDFNTGIFENITINGSGSNAELQLATFHQEWVNVSKPQNPGERVSHAMSSIWGTDKVLLFGGSKKGVSLNDTWLFDYSEKTWTELKPKNSPSPRWGVGLCSIYRTDKILLYGGTIGGTYYNETWIYNLSDDNWIDMNPPINPKTRARSQVDSIWGTDRVILFGGMGSLGYKGTWMYDLSENTWTEMKPPNEPKTPITSHGLANIFGTDKFVLFGGFFNFLDETSNETWVYDFSENNWTRKFPFNDPNDRGVHGMVSIYGTDKCLFFGGGNGTLLTNSIIFNDTWIYDLSENDWIQLYMDIDPGERSSHAIASIYGTQNVLMYSGFTYDPGFATILYNDTWIFYFDLYRNGYYISEGYNFGSDFSFKDIIWFSETPVNTSIKLQLRSASNESGLDTKEFVGPDGSNASYYTESPFNIWPGHNGDSWIQYKAYLSTNDATLTPTLKNVTISYNYFPETILIEPLNSTISSNNIPIFSWYFNDTDSTDQTTFQVLIDDDNSFNSVNYDSGEQLLPSKQWQFPDGTGYSTLTDGIWYWKVRTKDNDGDWGLFSEPWKLIIDTKKPGSSFISPENDAFYNKLNIIQGNANDTPGGTGLDKVELLIHYINENNYWDGSDWTSIVTWLPASGTTSWSYNASLIKWTSGQEYRVRSRAVDKAVNIEIPSAGINFKIDKERPMSTINNIINNSYLNSLFNVLGSANDEIDGSGLKSIEICIKSDSDEKYWDENFWVSEKTWLKTDDNNLWSYKLKNVDWVSDNTYTIFSRALDNAGNYEYPETSVSFMYDNRPPENLSISINEGALYTNSTTVILTLAAEDTGSGVSEMSLSYDGNNSMKWEDFKTIKTIDLSEKNGLKQVFFNVKDRAGNMAPSTTTSITLDTKPPEKLIMKINKGAVETNSTTVTLTISAEDTTSGISKMAFSTDGSSWTEWEDYIDSKLINLSTGDGIKYIYLKLKDNAGNTAEPIHASIILNTSKPIIDPDVIPDGDKKDTEKKSSGSSYLVIILIIIAIILILGIFLFFRKRKKPVEKDTEKVPASEVDQAPMDESGINEPFPEGQGTESVEQANLVNNQPVVSQLQESPSPPHGPTPIPMVNQGPTAPVQIDAQQTPLPQLAPATDFESQAKEPEQKRR